MIRRLERHLQAVERRLRAAGGLQGLERAAALWLVGERGRLLARLRRAEERSQAREFCGYTRCREPLCDGPVPLVRDVVEWAFDPEGGVWEPARYSKAYGCCRECGMPRGSPPEPPRVMTEADLGPVPDGDLPEWA